MSSPTETEIVAAVTVCIRDLGMRGTDTEDRTRILFSVAMNSVMLFICALKLQSGCSTAECRLEAINLLDTQLAKSDENGDRIITWHDGEARA